MKKINIGKNLLIIFLSTISTNSFAAAPIPVSATISTACTAVTNPLNFGSGPLNTILSTTANITITCDVETPVNMTLSGGSNYNSVSNIRQMIDTGTSALLSYTLYNANNAGPGKPLINTSQFSAGTFGPIASNFVLGAQLLMNQGITTGTFADTVTMILSY